MDPNYTLASDNGHTFGTDAFTTIQAGVDAVASGGTVEVDAGTYKEAVTINQALTLDGAMVGQDARGRSGDESIITAVGTSPNITVNASNVTIDGLTLDGPAGSSAAISMMGGATDSNEVVQNNIINDASRAVVFDTSNTTFNQNVVNQVDAADYIDGFEENTLAANSVSFTANDFNDGNNGGNSNADISFIGDPNDLSTGLVVQGNESLNGATLLAVTNTESASVTNNTATNDNQSAFFIGGNDLDITLPSNSITGDTAGGAILIANYFGYGPNSIASSFYNHFMNDSFGVDVDSSAGPALFTTATADFRNSWWGAANGPSDSNATDDSLPASNAGSGMPVIGAVNYGPWCATEDCTVDSDTPLAAPTGLTPTNDTYTNNSSYSNTWTPVAGAASYQYQSSETLKNSTQLGILYAVTTLVLATTLSLPHLLLERTATS